MGHLILSRPAIIVATLLVVAGAILLATLTGSTEDGQAPSVKVAPASALETWNAYLTDAPDVAPSLSSSEAISVARELAYPADAEIIGARLLQIEPGLDVDSPTVAWAVDFDTTTGDLNNPEGTRWLVAPYHVYYAIVIDAATGQPLFAVDGGRGSPIATDVPIAMVISNVDGPPLEVTTWDGAEPVSVPCPGSWVVAVKDAPEPPWHLVVRNSFTGEVMREETFGWRAQTPTVLVRRTAAIFGYGPASAGPAPVNGCLQEGDME